MPVDTEARLLGLFDNKAELLPLWQRLRPAVERLGPDVRVRPRMVYAEFDRCGDGPGELDAELAARIREAYDLALAR